MKKKWPGGRPWRRLALRLGVVVTFIYLVVVGVRKLVHGLSSSASLDLSIAGTFSVPVPQVFGGGNGKKDWWTVSSSLDDVLNGFSFTSPQIDPGQNSLDTVLVPPFDLAPPVIYTYFDPHAVQDPYRDARLVQIWRRAFASAGFTPVVLSRQDADPQKQSNGGMSEKALALDAWARVGGGILSDYRVVPMRVKSNTSYQEEGLAALQAYHYESSAQGLSTVEGMVGAIILGSHEGAAKLAAQVAQVGGDKAKIADILQENLGQQQPNEGLAYYSEHTVETLYPGVSTENLPDLINTHLHTAFLGRHEPGGITLVDPYPNKSKILSLPLSDLVGRIVMCSGSFLDVTCPPQPDGSSTTSCYTCAEAELLASRSLGLAPEDELTGAKKGIGEDEIEGFEIIYVPHPATVDSTLLGSNGQPDSGLTADGVRRSARDQWSKGLSKRLVSSPLVGSHMRANILKEQLLKAAPFHLNAIHSNSTESKALWITWEEALIASQQMQYMEKVIWNSVTEKRKTVMKKNKLNQGVNDAIDRIYQLHPALAILEHQLGFCLGRRNSRIFTELIAPVMEDDEVDGNSSSSSSNNNNDNNNNDKTSSKRIKEFQGLVGRKNPFVISSPVFASQSKQRKGLRQAAEAWNPADGEVWKFLTALQQIAATRLHL